MTAANSENGQKAQAKTAGARLLRKFTALKGAARELWITFAVKLLVIAAYAVTNSTLMLWLSSDLGYGDQNALRLVAAVMALTSLKWLALAGGLFPLAVGEALSTPVLVAAVRRYSTTGQRSISFSIFYVMMNVGFLAAAALFFDGGFANMSPHTAESFPVRLSARGVGLGQSANGFGKVIGPACLALIAGTLVMMVGLVFLAMAGKRREREQAAAAPTSERSSFGLALVVVGSFFLVFRVVFFAMLASHVIFVKKTI